jgi:hypothetical protein
MKIKTAPLTASDLLVFAEGAAVRYTLENNEKYAGIGIPRLENGNLIVRFDWLVLVQLMRDTKTESESDVLTAIPPIHEPYLMTFEHPMIENNPCDGWKDIQVDGAKVLLSHQQSHKLILQEMINHIPESRRV